MIELFISPRRTIEPATPEDLESIRRLRPGTGLEARSCGERNVRQHRYWRAMLQFIADNHPEDRFNDPETIHELIKIEAGFAKTVINQDGEVMYAIRSTRFGECTQEDFDAYLVKAMDIAWRKWLPAVDPVELNRYLEREGSWTHG